MENPKCKNIAGCGSQSLPVYFTVSSLFLFPLISNQAVGNVLVLYALLFSLPGWQADSYYKTSGQSVKYEWLIFYKKNNLEYDYKENGSDKPQT